MEHEICTALEGILPRLRLREPLYAVLLVWDPGQPRALPPLPALGQLTERESFLTQGPQAPRFLWNPAELELFDIAALSLEEEPDLETACRALDAQMWAAADWTPGWAMLARAARRLYDTVPRLVKVTDEFVCYATDFEGTRLEERMRASLPGARVDALRARGWLPEETRASLDQPTSGASSA